MSDRYLIEYEPTVTICDSEHPVRLARKDWYDGWSANGFGQIRGYVCPGGREHDRWEWHIWDTVTGDYATHDFYPTKREALQALRSLLVKVEP